MAQLKRPRRHAEVVLLAAEAPKPLPGSDAAERRADQVEADRRQVEAARDAAIALADQTVPSLKDAMDWAHEAEQGRGPGCMRGGLARVFLRLTALNALWLGIPPSFSHCHYGSRSGMVTVKPGVSMGRASWGERNRDP
jgi:hypothetical protein